MRRFCASALGFFLGLSMVGLSEPPSLASPPPPKALRILFIGNSLTAANDLPAIIQKLAASRGQALDYQMLAYPDYSLMDHWDKGEARAAIAKSRWDLVVLQQGPSASEEGRELLLKYGQLFADDIRRVGAKPALYLVWPTAARRGDFDRASESYQMAARKVKGTLVPAGEALREAEKRDNGLQLFSTDGFHPGPLGSYLIALVFYERLFGQSPVGLPSRLSSVGQGKAEIDVPARQAAALQTVASETNARFTSREDQP